MEFVPAALQSPVQAPASWKPGTEFVPQQQLLKQSVVWAMPAASCKSPCSTKSLSKARITKGASNMLGMKDLGNAHPAKQGAMLWRVAAKEAAKNALLARSDTHTLSEQATEISGASDMTSTQVSDAEEMSDDALLSQSEDFDSTVASERSSSPDLVSDDGGIAETSGEAQSLASAGEIQIVESSVFSRRFLLAWRDALQQDACPPSLKKLSVRQCETLWVPSKKTVFAKSRVHHGSAEKTARHASGSRHASGLKLAIANPDSMGQGPVLPPQSESAYRIVKMDQPLSREKKLQREVKSLLNKVCPENVDTIVRRVATIELSSVDELELVITLLFEKALVEPHYCETYTEMVAKLQQLIPHFKGEDGNPITFKSALLRVTQNEFESMSDVLTIGGESNDLDKAEIEHLKRKRKDRVVANMKFIGQLFLRQLLSARVIASILRELAGEGDAAHVPDAPVVECLCELLTNIGSTLEASTAGRAVLSSILGRLKDLQGRSNPGGSNSGKVYSKRIQFAIQDVVDMKEIGWTKKVVKELAKTKEEIRKEHAQDSRSRR